VTTVWWARLPAKTRKRLGLKADGRRIDPGALLLVVPQLRLGSGTRSGGVDSPVNSIRTTVSPCQQCDGAADAEQTSSRRPSQKGASSTRTDPDWNMAARTATGESGLALTRSRYEVTKRE